MPKIKKAKESPCTSLPMMKLADLQPPELDLRTGRPL